MDTSIWVCLKIGMLIFPMTRCWEHDYFSAISGSMVTPFQVLERCFMLFFQLERPGFEDGGVLGLAVPSMLKAFDHFQRIPWKLHSFLDMYFQVK